MVKFVSGSQTWPGSVSSFNELPLISPVWALPDQVAAWYHSSTTGFLVYPLFLLFHSAPPKVDPQCKILESWVSGTQNPDILGIGNVKPLVLAIGNVKS